MDGFYEAYEIQLTELFRMAVALLCGAIVGIERERTQKGAGFRTHILICLGACVFALVGLRVNQQFPMSDPLRLVQGVLLGIGFISGGVIMTEGGSVKGLTTAAGLWLITAVGLALGLGYYLLGVTTTVLTLIVMSLFRPLRRKIAEAADQNGHTEEKPTSKKLASAANSAAGDAIEGEEHEVHGAPAPKKKTQRLTTGG